MKLTFGTDIKHHRILSVSSRVDAMKKRAIISVIGVVAVAVISSVLLYQLMAEGESLGNLGLVGVFLRLPESGKERKRNNVAPFSPAFSLSRLLTFSLFSFIADVTPDFSSVCQTLVGWSYVA